MTRVARSATRGRAFAAALCAALALARAAAADQIVLEPVKDNTIFEEGNLSNGAGTRLFAGVTGGSKRRRALLAFDVAGAIPAGATITSAQLTMRVTMSIAGSRTMTLHRVLADWGEGASNSTVMGGGMGAAAAPGDATWSFRIFDTQMWATAGGDFAAAASATQQVSGATATWSSTTVLVADVQGWLDAPGGNFGWLLRGDETDSSSAKRFGSREADSTTRPKLTIDFDPPGGGATATPTVTAQVPTATASPSPSSTVALPSVTVPATITAIPATATAEPTATTTAAPPTPPTATATPTLSVSPADPTPTVTPTLPLVACVGDCDDSGSVTINDLILGVNIALGRQPVAACLVFDPSGSGRVEINELIAAINNALGGCPA